MKNDQLVRDLKNAISDLIDSMDDQFDDRLEMYADVMLDPTNSDLDQIEENFRRNYSSRSIGKIKNDELDGNELADLLIKSMGQKEFVRLIAEHSYFQTSDYYVKWNEMDSIQVGEVEHQIDVDYEPTLKALIDQATDEQLKEAGIDDRDMFFVYGNPCDRVIAKLDAEKFLKDKKVKAAIRRASMAVV
jgi:hypothetical protein